MSRNLIIELPPVSVIIPAYNEEAFLGMTITGVLESGFPCELIIVDDGSTDQTSQILKGFEPRIRVVRHPVNRGKGAAMASGVRTAAGEIVVFCDAHVLGLRQYHFLSLVLPLLQGPTRAVLGVAMPRTPPFPWLIMPILTGQRAYFRRDLEPLLVTMERLGYGVETFLFRCFPLRQTAVVLLPGLIHLIKPQFLSPPAVAKGYWRESVEILGTLAWLGKEHGTALLRRKIWPKGGFPKPSVFA
ncbi:MAG: glycosyltransferase family 2 protein [Thermoflexales bacterium]|nr:glycosyltransferase family 2 protein [Thermoflexales bacterium]